jgi:hypothetical protein
VAALGLLSVLLTGTFAVARDQDDRKDQSSQSSRSSNSSGASSSRSMSSSQSQSSLSSDASRSFSERSRQSIQIPTSDRATRSFGDGARGSTFTGESISSRSSYGRSSDIGSSTIRSFGNQSVARPIDGTLPNRDAGNTGSTFRGFSRGTATADDSDSRGPRNSNNGLSDSSLFNRFSNVSPQSDRSSDNSSRNGSKAVMQNRDSNTGNQDSSGVIRNFNGQKNQTGNSQLPANTFGTGRADNRFGRSQQNQSDTQGSGSKLTKDKVDAFLQLRRDNNGTNPTAGGADRAFGGKFGRDANLTNLTNDGRKMAGIGQFGSQNQLTDSKKVADETWIKRFGKPDDTPGDRSKLNKDGKMRDGKNDLGPGVVNLHGNVPGGTDHKFDKNLIDRNYQDWRKSALDNKHGADSDHRDWSGQWKNGDRFVAADQIRDHWKKNGKGNGKDLPFSKDWWSSHDHHDGDAHHDGHDHHDGHWNHWDHFGDHHYHPYHWWSWCSAPLLTTWCTFGWNEPCYWDYGPGEYIYCNNGIVYVNGTWFEPAPLFYRRTLFLAQQAPIWTPVQAAQIDWLPLGVFVVSRDGVPDNNVLVQIAVTKEGVIGGTIFNQLTGATFPIQGMVDKQTQRAAWTYTDDLGAQIVMESSIFNLTQPAATGLIHYSPDNIQVIELVRLEDPNAGN